MRKTVGVLTSGGDAPGMNAAIRAVVRCSLHEGYRVLGIDRGYEGLIEDLVEEMDSRSVSEVINRGGTILQTARSMQFMKEEGRNIAKKTCEKHEIDVLVVIGGDGSYKGAHKLSKLGVNVICIPGTIDLDIGSTEYTIGFDTAVNTAMEAIEKIRDTSSSHNRCSVVEVMGRNTGYIALWCGIAGGAEIVLIPEEKREIEEIVETVKNNKDKGKIHELIIVAEGVGNTKSLVETIEKETGITTRATVLGYLQRGGKPTAIDRLHASMMGAKAVDLITKEKYNKAVALKSGEYIDINLEEAINMKKNINKKMCNVAKALSY